MHRTSFLVGILARILAVILVISMAWIVSCWLTSTQIPIAPPPQAASGPGPFSTQISFAIGPPPKAKPDLVTVEKEFLLYTAKAGDLSRQLDFAAIAIIWLFVLTRKQERFALPIAFRWPLFLVCTSLAIDIFQYIYGCGKLSLLWFNGQGGDYVVDHQAEASFPVKLIFLKLFAMGLAYGFLLWAVCQRVVFEPPNTPPSTQPSP